MKSSAAKPNRARNSLGAGPGQNGLVLVAQPQSLHHLRVLADIPLHRQAGGTGGGVVTRRRACQFEAAEAAAAGVGFGCHDVAPSWKMHWQGEGRRPPRTGAEYLCAGQLARAVKVRCRRRPAGLFPCTFIRAW